MTEKRNMNVQQYIASQYHRFLEDLETIVNIDSGSTSLIGIKAVATFFQKRFDALGMTTRILELGKRGVPCLKAFTKNRNNRFDLLMVGHMDTAFPEGEASRRPFSIDGTRAMGPGVCDMKGGLLTALYALEALKHEGVLDNLAVCVTFNGDEELGSVDSKPWIEENSLLSDHVFVFESCRKGYNYVLERKGGGWITVDAKGKASHAGSAPERGANAVLEIAQQVIHFHNLNSPDKGTSVQATMISGGHRENIVPDSASLLVDVRVKDMPEAIRINEYLKELPSNPKVEGVTLSVSGGISRPPMVPDEKTVKLWKIIEEAGLNAGITPNFAPRGGGSDGNFTAALGIPTVDGMGASGEHAHTVEEYLDLTSIVPLTTVATLACITLVEKRGKI